jgi:hypothetical protein
MTVGFFFSFVGPAGQQHGAGGGLSFFIFMKMIARRVTWRTAKPSARRLYLCLRQSLLVTFLAVRANRRRTTKIGYRAIICRVAFAVASFR